jgi:tRNA(Ile)-lysidine synthase
MIQRVKHFIQVHHLITPDYKTIYVAVSGGVDSCVLLDIMYRLRDELKYQLKILHFNHKIRGEASYTDEQFVEELANKYELPIQIDRIKGKPLRASETYLREHRLKFFSGIVAQTNNSLLATGHNLDDNIETFIMRLAKGSRLKGLLAMRPAQGIFIRPLLAFTRPEILNYACKQRLRYSEDKTNLDTTILRNRIRHHILPYLRTELNDQFSRNVSKVISDLNEYYQIYETNLKEAVTQAIRKSKNGILLNRKRYLQFNTAIRRGLIEYCISAIYPLNYIVSDKNLAAWDLFIRESKPGKKYSFLENGMALAERNHVRFGDLPQEKKEKFRLQLESPLNIENKYKISFEKILAEEVTFTSNKNVEYIDGKKSGDLLNVRFWKKGDKFKPLGMEHRRKLSDFFIDLKLNSALKKEIPIICKDDQIIWIAGYRLDDQFKISDKTKKVYKLQIVKLKQT